ncbi:MAG: triacylglycerol lipase [Ruminococcaceae bacterium]|nr:triacylglycerol lipase [Oscillospiraceae bacterium]
MKNNKFLFRIFFLILFSFAANSYLGAVKYPVVLYSAIAAILISNIFIGFTDTSILKTRMKFCNHGAECLLIFCMSIVISATYHLVTFLLIPWDLEQFIWSVVTTVIAHAILFWNGIICVYLTAAHLGIKQRIIGIICGPIPIAHLFALRSIMKTVYSELKFEAKNDDRDRERLNDQICKTKYPIVLVHGVFFRDSKYINYWGRIPESLKLNGAEIFYGNHQSALSVADSAAELVEHIKKILQKTGAEKVNVIGHSKGGLDTRYAIHNLGADKYIASLTTVNSPHRGCEFADYLLDKIPVDIQKKVAGAYNIMARHLGDTTPDFMAAVQDLRASVCTEFDKNTPKPEGILCQSIGSIQKNSTSGRFPLNLSYLMVNNFGGENDGLVTADSFEWGDKYTLLRPIGDRGISHMDVIDLAREDIPEFDVREFYVELVADLKNKGL